MKSSAKAYVNIALIKYWGKTDEVLKLPFNSSLSLTIDQFYTTTTVNYLPQLSEDVLYIDHQLITGNELKRVKDLMDIIRKQFGVGSFAEISSVNHVPKAAGLASSSSAFAALVAAATNALGLNLSHTELSKLARLGSGSACRSIFGNFTIWQKGSSHETSYAYEFAKWEDFRVIVCLLDKSEKTISSSEGMRLAVKHPQYLEYVKQSEIDLTLIKEAIVQQDIHKTGQIAQSNAIRMHQLINACGINYWNDKTIKLIEKIKDLQQKIPVYFTVDAGPNVKLLTTKKYLNEVMSHLTHIETVVCQAGKEVEII